MPPVRETGTVPRVTNAVDIRRSRAAAAWGLTDEVVLIGAGEPIPVPGGRDQTFPFISHSEYFYLADRECAGGVLAFDPGGGWVDFVPEVSEAERIWEGREGVEGTPLTELPAWLAVRRRRRLAMLGTPLPGVRFDTARAEELREILTHVRRPKDEIELERMRRAAAASLAGYAVAERMIRPGVSEREVQIEMEAEFFRHGATRTGYDTIVGSGPNSAVLHFAPTSRRIGEGETVLIDAGAEVDRYISDITRTFRAGGPGDGFFRDLYRVVLAAEQRAIAACRVGVEYRDIHLAAAADLAAGLVELGILRGAADTLVERDAHALFFPHGIGHMVGLGVRDASGFLPGHTRSPLPSLRHLRTDLPLEKGYVMTIEPGIYFIPALLNDPERRAMFRQAVNWDRVDSLIDFGGIRIEDNVLVTEGEPETLTAAVPKII